MTGQKKIIVIIAILAVVFIIFMVTGTYLDRMPRPEPDKKTAESYENNKWAKRLGKPISMFTPSLSPNDFQILSSLQGKCRFTIAEDEDSAFRSLNLSIEPLAGVSGNSAECGVSYGAKGPAMDKLKNQSDTLEGRSDTTTVVVQKGGGNLDLSPVKGVRVLMKHGRSYTMICERNRGGDISINSVFSR